MGSAEYIDSMFSSLLKGTSRVLNLLPSQCRVCHAWPAQPICETCVSRFAQPQPRCETCALPVPPHIRRCGACVKAPPPLDACLAAVAYAFPWSDLIVDYKFHNNPRPGQCLRSVAAQHAVGGTRAGRSRPRADHAALQTTPANARLQPGPVAGAPSRT